MLDPFSAISAAAAVLQLVEYGGKLVGAAREIYRSADSVLEENVDIERCTADIKALALKLQTTPLSDLPTTTAIETESEVTGTPRVEKRLNWQGKFGKLGGLSSTNNSDSLIASEERLQRAAQTYAGIAQDLLSLLAELKRRTSGYKSWDAVQRAVKSLRKKSEIERLQKDLERVGSAVSLHLLHTLK